MPDSPLQPHTPVGIDWDSLSALICNGETALFAEHLQKAPQDIAALRDEAGRSLLHVAAYADRLEMVELLLNMDWKLALTQTMDGQSPIVHAILKGADQVVALLLERVPGIIHLVDIGGKSPLLFAIMCDNRVIVSMLLAKCPALAFVNDKYGQTPLQHAQSSTFAQCTDLLKSISVADT